MSNRRSGRSGTDEVHSITSTQGPLGEDIDRRARRYLAQMTVRTLCFVGAVLSWGRVPTWLSVTLLLGAVVLPYIAVVLANAGRERPERAMSPLELRELGAGPAVPPQATPTTAPPTGYAPWTGPTGPTQPTEPAAWTDRARYAGPVGPHRPGGDGPRRD